MLVNTRIRLQPTESKFIRGKASQIDVPNGFENSGKSSGIESRRENILLTFSECSCLRALSFVICPEFSLVMFGYENYDEAGLIGVYGA